jgi:hypothetical protein
MDNANRCSECGAPLGGHHWRVCTACGKLFCRRHLIIERDVALCAACQHDRERRQAGDGT